MNYRPLTDVWILARPKVRYYGAYPAGFLHRARALLGVGPADAVLHVCAGQVRQYPYRGLGPNDKTVDLDPDTKPDYVLDVRESMPCRHDDAEDQADIIPIGSCRVPESDECLWPGILIDRPYSEDDADRYATGRRTLPALNPLLRGALARVPVGHRVGVLDYQWPSPGKTGQEVAVVAVGTGRNARARWFTVWERVAP